MRRTGENCLRIACAGGGPAGLYFAILMKERDRNHDITVFERNPAGVTYGWGVVFWDNLLDQLYASHPPTAREISASAFRWKGQQLAVEGREPVHLEGSGYGIGRHRLLELLVDRARALGVDVRFEHDVGAGAAPEGDLIVACDGVNSRLRQLHAGEFETRVHVGRNRYIWLGTTKVFDTFTFAFVPTAAGWIWCHAYGFDGETSTFIVECSPETWSGLGFDQLGRDETVALLEQLFASQLEGHALRTSVGGNGGAPWLNFRTLTNKTWRHENIVLMGDAAHTTHFTIGSGTKLALEDAIALAAKLSEASTLEQALVEYQLERKLALRFAQTEARLSARWFENVRRYVELDPPRLFVLLRLRRSPLLPHIPPSVYYRLYETTRNVRALRKVRRWVGPRVRALYGR
jgi:2-polyprenyl-6-methoxyphenol hydroxylase-like FAD-dependent oxidoreductase